MSRKHAFLRDDYDALKAKIEAIRQEMKSIGRDMGASCEEGAETFHDNFTHEDGTRQLYMLGKRFRELQREMEMAEIVDPSPDGSMVGLGRTVTIEEENGTQSTYRIGSYRILTEDPDGDPRTISYNSPLARLLIGGEVGDTREGYIADQHREFTIIRVS